MNRPRVLVVDDELQMRRLLEATLHARDYVVLLAATGTVALELAATARADLIVLDLGLPDIDGIEVCRRIRAWSQVPIIVLSARDDEYAKVNALDLGADDYLTKPFGMQELLARLRVALRHAQPMCPARRSYELATSRLIFTGDRCCARARSCI